MKTPIKIILWCFAIFLMLSLLFIIAAFIEMFLMVS